MKKIVLVSGGFDPLHSGHIKYFKEARRLGDELVVGINSDMWLAKKKGKPFLLLNERKEIIKNLKMVKRVKTWDDNDGSAIKLIESLLIEEKGNFIIFANGGDRTEVNTPELERFKNNKNINFSFGVGGTKKINSSSKILKEWKVEN